MKKKIVLGTMAILLAASLVWCLSITVRFPYIGIYLVQNSQNEWVVKELDKDSASQSMDLKVGDKVLLVDDQPTGEFRFVKEWGTIEQASRLTLSRNGEEKEILLDGKSTLYNITTLIGMSVSLFMALLLLIKISNSHSASLLSLVFLNCAGIWCSLGASLRGDALGKYLITTLMIALPVLFLHFLLAFFNEKAGLKLSNKILKYLYAIVAMGACIKVLNFVPAYSLAFRLLDSRITLLLFMVGFIINITLLTVIYFKHSRETSMLSTVIKSVWVGLFISFVPFTCLSILPKLFLGDDAVSYSYSSISILLFPIFFAYLIASNQLYDIGLVLRRIIAAFIIAIVPCGLYVGLYAALFPHEADAKHLLFTAGSSLILVTCLLYSTEYLTTKLEPFLFPRKFTLRSALKKISKRLEAISSFRELKDMVLLDIVDTLQVMGGAIVLKFKDHSETIHEGQIDPAIVEQLIESPALAGHPYYTIIEINRHEEYTSYLVMTRKKTNTLLSMEEVQWLTLITTYLAVSLENVHLIRKLRMRLQELASQLPDDPEVRDIQWFRKIMYELQEEERMRIATDLHDTTMQDLFFLKRRFVSLMDKYVMNKEDKDSLGNIINFVELINMNLRESCFELHPYLLQEIGLIQTVGKLLDKEAYHTPFKIEFHAEKAAQIEQKDLPTKKHIFRMIQELLNNAKKHSQASKVTFGMDIVDGFFWLTYKDNGVGLDSGVVRASKEIGASGIGLEQIRVRTLHMGGRIQLASTPGNGVACKIAIPLQAKESVSV